MKLKSHPVPNATSLMALFFILTFSAPLLAQNSIQKPKTTNAVVAEKPDVVVAKKTTDSPPKSIPSVSQIAKTPAAAKSETAQKTTTPRKNADYWFDLGALCATYGNDRAAIRHFQKAISIAPQRSDAYFEQGISYGQLGKFDKAIALVDKAVQMEPNNGLYYYGRGRVYLLAGKKDQALENFKKAAELDDEDAQNYLNLVAQTD